VSTHNISIEFKGGVFTLQFMLTGYFRTFLLGEKATRLTNIGTGLYVIDKDSPTDAKGGVILELRDLFENAGSVSVGTRLVVSRWLTFQ